MLELWMAREAWGHPWPVGPVVADAGHCGECGRLAALLDRPWFELDLDVFARLRAYPGFLTFEAFAHYLPGFLVAAETDYYWDRDHFERVLDCLTVRGYGWHGDAEVRGRVAAIGDGEWQIAMRALTDIALTREANGVWRPQRDRDARLAALAASRNAEGPVAHESGVWHWAGLLRSRIEASFPAMRIAPGLLVHGDPDVSTDTRMIFSMFAERTWIAAPVAQVRREADSMFSLRPETFAACLPAFLWAALEPTDDGDSRERTVETLAAIRKRDPDWGGPLWRALTREQRRVVGEAIVGVSRFHDDAEYAEVGQAWIADAERDA